MKLALKLVGLLLALLLLAAGGLGGWYLYQKQPVRSGVIELTDLGNKVTVRYDERGVPHISAQNEADLYRALGYVHAQDRLFQLEMVRRLANGELAEVLGPKLLEVDKLFRTLGLREHAKKIVAAMDRSTPANQALLNYLDGINQYQDKHRVPLEFDILGITPHPFTPEDTYAVGGYLAYSFAAAFRNEPVMTFIRDKLGPDYLRAFDIEWHPEGVITPLTAGSARLNDSDWNSLNRIAAVSLQATELGGIPLLEGSNAWAISGKRTESGSPLLAGDPHIAFSAPAVWYEAHLSSPGFELFGHFQALNPTALLGHNQDFGWSLTMFQNDDIDLIAEKVNPENPQQVWHQGRWVDMGTRSELIQVKGEPPVRISLRSTPNGPVINDAFKDSLGATPISMWWAFLSTENPVQQAFYELNRADTLEKARNAASKIHAPGLNIVWANAKGDIAWWAAGLLPQRPQGVNPTFVLDATKGEDQKPGFYAFQFNPQEENPARGYIMSANHQPQPKSGVPVAGYYNLPDRAQRLDALLQTPDLKWNSAEARKLQLDVTNNYGPRILRDLLPVMAAVVTDPNDKAFMEPLTKWDGAYTEDSIAATLFTQMMYELSKAAFADELGPVQFENLRQSRALDHALPLLVADPASPWWDDVSTPAKESHFETVRIAWSNTLKHLQGLYGTSLLDWRWGSAHTLTHGHPLGRQKPLDKIFNVGPFPVPGGRETPNNLSGSIGPAPWAVTYGPSTRRVIDFADSGKAVGINPLGQSGVWPDQHYADQAEKYVKGEYVRMWLDEADIAAHTESTLVLRPAR
ncbi:penicillin acylase family protein [Rhodoferax mekongensis]|uniref:Penicillin acylase family protein n=1 Tax=Rhodoferax mekongensis TaxID=3068341 RepID=A0ABZ0AZE9_9BURK|nr:penicillin acylase family protein [Rhodoferax sp. TBRC 17307]WNO04067.1 penicillin acylase family protein [Rhodoferax sp. TBRC 17307]